MSGGNREIGNFTWSTLLATVYLPTALMSVVRGMLLVTIPLYVNLLRAPTTLIGVAVAAMSLGTLFSDIPSSFVLGRLGQKNTSVISFIIMATGLAGLTLSVTFEGVVFWTILLGVGTALWSLSRHVFITTQVPFDYRGRASALTGASERIGLSIGPVLGGLSVASFGYSFSSATGIGITLTGLLIYGLWTKDPGYAPLSSEGIQGQSVGPQHLRLDPALRRVILLGLGQTIIHVVRYGRYFLIPVYGKLVLNMPDIAIGLVMGLSALLDVATSYPSGVILDKLGRGFSVATSFTIMSLGLMVMALSPNELIFTLSVAIIGVGNGFGAGMMLTLGSDIGAEYDTRTAPKFLGVWHFMGNLGNTIGPLSLGILAGLVGIHYSSLTLGIVALSIAFAMPRLIRSLMLAQT